jgi:hypothetical protein
MAGQPIYPGAPRWLKLSAMVGGVAALLVVILVHVSGAASHHFAFVGDPAHRSAAEAGH